MSTFLSIRNYPAFRRYFDAVHPFFWPVLYWQLKKAWLYVQREKITGALLAITWWGGVRIVCEGDKLPQPDPLAPTKPHWSDPVWASGMPAIVSDLTPPCALILAQEADAPVLRSLRRSRKGALRSPLDTS